MASIMKRSEINTILQEAKRFLAANKFHLPPFAVWTPDAWKECGAEAREIVECGLGWDITDFGSDDFGRCGLFLFTLRNGRRTGLQSGTGKVYAEKVMIVEVGQITPLHFHWQKMEDIIVRGGGELVVQLFNSTPDGGLATSNVTVQLDGIRRTVQAGATVTLRAGESITLEPGVYHKFWGAKARVLVGEVSTVNDDATDNRSYEPAGRFPEIVENAPPLHLLVSDYARCCAHLPLGAPTPGPAPAASEVHTNAN